MDIVITPDKTLKEISDEFHTKFPFLKLNFYSSAHDAHEASSIWDTLNPDLKISQVSEKVPVDHLSINGHLKVANFEQEFQRRYDFGVQVMRKQGDRWIQTVSSDDWTISEQNREGERASQHA